MILWFISTPIPHAPSLIQGADPIPTNYTDALGNPISVGDLVVYPTCSGSSAADLNHAVVTEILTLIPNDPSDPRKNAAHLMSDIGKGNKPTRYIPRTPSGDFETIASSYGQRTFERAVMIRDDSKAYLLRVKRTKAGSRGNKDLPDGLVMLKNVDRVVVVTSLVQA